MKTCDVVVFISGQNAGKAHLLSDVINNIELYADYYQRSTLSFYIAVNHEFYKRLESAGKV